MARPFSRHVRGDFTPAACIRDGRADDIIDLGADDIDGYGRIYLCTVCLAELAQAMDFVDITALQASQAESKHWKKEFESVTRVANDIPGRVRTRTKELADGIRALADDFGNAIVADSRVRAGLLVPAGAEKPANAGGGAVGVSGEDDGDSVAANPESTGRDGIGNLGGAGEPDRSVDNGDTGIGPAADVVAEVDGPDLDESFGWIEFDTGADGGDPAVGNDPAGD